MEMWSVWLIMGAVCIGLELFIPGFVIIFFGFGCILTSVCCVIPLIQNVIWFQIILFLFFSIISLVFLRKRFTFVFKGSIFYPDRKNDVYSSDFADVLEDVSDIKEGRIKFNGTTWNARTISGNIETGKRVKVLRREGITYIVENVKN